VRLSGTARLYDFHHTHAVDRQQNNDTNLPASRAIARDPIVIATRSTV